MNVKLATRYFNNWNAGLGVYSKQILKEMIERGHDVCPVSTTFKGSTGYFYYDLVELFKEFKISLFPEERMDVIHALSPLESLWTDNDKTVTTFHDLIPILHREKETWHFEGMFPRFRRWFGSWWFKKCAESGAKSERIICNSEHTKEEVVELFDVPEDKVTVTRLGISDRLTPVKNTSYNSKDFTVGTLSHLSPRKRIDILIEEFMKIDNENSELLIPSKGEDKKRLERIAKDDDRVKFIGYLPDNKKAEYLSSLDVFVLPSKLEGYGLGWVEAMACKTPVVSFEDAIMPSDIQKRTHVVDRDGLADLLRDREYDCDIDENYEFAQLHDWKICAEKTEEVYEEVVN